MGTGSAADIPRIRVFLRRVADLVGPYRVRAGVVFGCLLGEMAFQACGISIFRLLRPVLLVAAVSWALTSYIMLVSVPYANQTFREIVYGVVSARAENESKNLLLSYVLTPHLRAGFYESAESVLR
jgi:hypothetical protein